MLLEEDFFESERQIFTTLRDAGFNPSIILDIGASNGEWTDACLKIFPNPAYRLYEPLYSHLAHYRDGLDELMAKNKNVSVRAVALADKIGVTDFFIMPNFVGSSLLPLKMARKVEVEGTTLDQELSGELPGPSIVKMDTQGGELLVLKGARNVIRRASVIVAECWLYHGYGKPTPIINQIIGELTQHDFHAFAMAAPYFDERNVLCALDVYFANKKILELIGAHPLSRQRDHRDDALLV
jgi:FkbM family methyltransferase